MSRPRVLLVDDDPGILTLVRVNLEARGYSVAVAQKGATALDHLEKQEPDLVILDVLLPDTDGHRVCQRIRERSGVPIIMLTVKTDEAEKVAFLDLGADDYLTKPFGVEELLARVKAVLRRTRPQDPHTEPALFTSGALQVDFENRRVAINGRTSRLTPNEYKLLREFVLNPGKILTGAVLLQRVWGLEYGTEIEYLRVYVGRLRKKIEADPTQPRFLLTEPRVGYRFQPSPD